MDISIVSGTYNRIDYLQQMIESARQSFADCYGLKYEFVLVDGNSQDGTQEWCKMQSDVRLIQHDSLLGAVKAFNDGAYAATGQYVILANDDIEFLDDSILTAWLYMQEHKECGVGCFFQDRERQSMPDSNPDKWKVEEMRVVRDGHQANGFYGQICIVPKWLGDSVGWWGDYLYTYGGDNELSSNIPELGFKVSPVPGAKIHDLEAEDELRKINNQGRMTNPQKTKGNHPDSWAYGRKWTLGRGGLSGPVIREGAEDHTDRKERILYLPIFEQGWPIQKEQKRGLRDALAKKALVIEYDYVQRFASVGSVTMFSELLDICHKIHPTIILTQIHNAEQISADYIRRLRQANPIAKMINWNGDVWPDNLLSENGIQLAKAFDWQLIINREVIEKYKQLGVNAEYWQIGYEPDGVGHKAIGVTNSNYDVCFLANGYSQERQNLVKKLRGLDIDFGLYGSGWPEGWADGQSTYDFISACKVYQGSKISIGDSQWPETGFVSNRVFQALAGGGAILAHEWFKDMDKLGLIDGVTCIIWKDFAELEEKITYYLSHEIVRKQVADAGQQLAFDRHSFDTRVTELFEMINQEQEHWRL